MLRASRRTFAALALAAGLTALLEIGTGLASVDDKELAQVLRTGGLVIVLRHGATRSDQADTDPVDFDNIAAQRNLNDKGKAAAVAFGDALRRIGAPVGKVYTSRFNRAYETATLAGFTGIEKTADLTYGGSTADGARRAAAVRKMLSTAPPPGSNTILVTHTPNIVDALGKDWEDVKEGEASIFRPASGGYALVARVQMEDWPRIAAAK